MCYSIRTVAANPPSEWTIFAITTVLLYNCAEEYCLFLCAFVQMNHLHTSQVDEAAFRRSPSTHARCSPYTVGTSAAGYLNVQGPALPPVVPGHQTTS